MMMDKRNGRPAWLLILAFAFALGGCVETDTSSGGGGEDTTDDSGDDGGVTTLALTAFSVDGTYETTDGTIPITPSMNDGAFTMNWSVEGFDETGGLYDSFGYNYYVAEAYLSGDAVVDDNDLSLFWARCGDPDYVCTHEGMQSQTCYFGSDNAFVCNIPQTDSDDLYWRLNGYEGPNEFFASGLPKSAYIVMEVCDLMHANCDSQAVAVEFE